MAKKTATKPILSQKGQLKLKKVMSEFKAGTLKDSEGNIIKSRFRALAIGFSVVSSIKGRKKK